MVEGGQREAAIHCTVIAWSGSAVGRRYSARMLLHDCQCLPCRLVVGDISVVVDLNLVRLISGWCWWQRSDEV